MSTRREVNVKRPEHSWIPFYRELARTLAEDGWRERQPELVGKLKEIREEGVKMPEMLDGLDDWIDPFTLFAIIARELTPKNYESVLTAYKGKFELESSLPEEKPFITLNYALHLGFFPAEGDIPTYVSDLWDLFELVWDMDPFAPDAQLTELATKYDACNRIPGVGTAKLTGCFYLFNPAMFLTDDTINKVIGRTALVSNSTGANYISFFERSSGPRQ